jgi:hypothetical protein
MVRITAKVVVQDACAKIIDKAGTRRQFQEVRDAAQVLPPMLEAAHAGCCAQGASFCTYGVSAQHEQ